MLDPHYNNALNYKTIVRYLASLENILFHNVFKPLAKEARTFIDPLPPPSLGFYLSPIATIEFGSNLIEKWYEFNQNSQ